MRRVIGSLLAASLLVMAGAAPARAQLSSYHLPVEPAILESHLDVQFQYSRISIGGPLAGAADVNVALLSIEGQIKLGMFEIGLNVPFLVHGYTTGADSTQFGNIMLGLKARLFGLASKFALSVFLNTYLPTHSSDALTHAFVQLQGGVVASVHLLGFDVGGGVQTFWTIIGDNRPDVGLLGFYGYGRVPILGVIAVQAAIEYFNSVHPSGELNAFLVTPSVELSVAWFHAGIGVRIAVTDDAKLLTLGRAALIANAGLRF